MTDVVLIEETLEQYWLDIRGIKSNEEGIRLTEEQAQDILSSIGIEGPLKITTVHEYNHVYRIECGHETLFLKLFTKSWYTTPNESTFCIDHECAAWRALALHGVATPEVLIATQENTNPLGMPFILTRKLRGDSLDTVLRGEAVSEIPALLFTLGRYMRDMHSIPFNSPGYLTSNGPTQTLDVDEWQFGLWNAHQCQVDTQVWLDSIRPTLSDEVAQRLDGRIATLAQELAPEYEQLYFTHGDCHLEQFFLHKEQGQWHVNGVVDMEVASAGACAADIVYICRELAQMLPPSLRWWESLFEGYGTIPHFERFRLRLLNCWYPYGPHVWPGSGDKGFSHLLNAMNWEELFSDTHLTK